MEVFSRPRLFNVLRFGALAQYIHRCGLPDLSPPHQQLQIEHKHEAKDFNAT